MSSDDANSNTLEHASEPRPVQYLPRASAFGFWIRAERERAQLSLNDFARSIDISPAYWSRIERGMEKAPKDDLILAACKRLGLDTDRAFIEARRLPPDVQDDIATAVRAYRVFKSASRG